LCSDRLRGFQTAGGDPFYALGNPRRRAILRLLVSSPLSVREIASELPVTRQAVARHLGFLAAAGLVAGCEVDGRRAWQLNEQGLGPVRNYLEILERG